MDERRVVVQGRKGRGSPDANRQAAWAAALVAGGTMLGTLGCGSDQATQPFEESEPIGATQQKYSSVGIERVIPLRVIQTFYLSAADQRAHYANMQNQLEVANSTYHTAGIQFYIASWRVCATAPNYPLSAPDDPTLVPWATVQQDIACALPGATTTSTDSHTSRFWMDWATVEFGDPRELVIWLRPGGGHDAAGPWAGNYVHFNSSSTSYEKLAHEFTHSLGLPHTFSVEGHTVHPNVIDPETGQNFQMADFWDLVYKPGYAGANQYFSSKQEALAVPGLRQIDRSGNCSADANNRLFCSICRNGADTCSFYDAEYVQHPDSDPNHALKGLAFTYATADNPPASYRYGTNAGSYNHFSRYVSISASGARIARKFLRFDTVLNDESGSDHVGDINRTSRRGFVQNRLPSWTLDFDHDGKRDIGLWTPPTTTGADGLFNITLSTGASLTVNLGRLGDIPVPADYNGDGATDLAVFIPGGGPNHDTPTDNQAYWRICPTNYASPATPCTTSSIVTYQFGIRDDVPLPGLDFDGNASTSHLAIFRPSSHLWVWQPVGNWDPAVDEYRYLGTSNSTVPLPGRYEAGDNLTDIAAYDSTTGNFHMLLSSSNWNTTVVRPFPMPPAGSRSVPMAIPGMASHVLVPGSSPSIRVPVHALATWRPDNGTWNVLWNPAVQTTPLSCQWGADGDIPLGGVGMTTQSSLFGATYSKMSVYRPSTGMFHWRTPTFSTCDSATSSTTLNWVNLEKYQVAVVSDITGDRLPEVMMVDQEGGWLSYLTSESGYQTRYNYSNMNHLKVVL